MLRSLHVKNLALIRETEVEFGEGLNILTGETGAGKSLLIGAESSRKTCSDGEKRAVWWNWSLTVRKRGLRKS